METRQIVIDVPEKVLLAEQTDEVGFSRVLPRKRDPLQFLSTSLYKYRNV